MPDIAAFDFDGTVTTGGSVFGFLSAVTGRRLVVVASIALSPRLAHAALAGGTVADETKERLFQRVLAGVETSHLDTASIEFAKGHLASHLRADVHRRFIWHQQRGDHTVIVSASPESYVREAGRLLGSEQASGFAYVAFGRGRHNDRVVSSLLVPDKPSVDISAQVAGQVTLRELDTRRVEMGGLDTGQDPLEEALFGLVRYGAPGQSGMGQARGEGD